MPSRAPCHGGWLFVNVETAARVPSIWLGWFYTWPSMGWREIPASVWEGATTFFTGAGAYNSSLWTMRYEFAGSFVVLAAALFVSRLRRRRFCALGLFWLVASLCSPYVGAFIAGLALALWCERAPRGDWGAVARPAPWPSPSSWPASIEARPLRRLPASMPGWSRWGRGAWRRSRCFSTPSPPSC